jgi:hypothetical protein
MEMDEFSAILRARELVRAVNPSAIPVSVEAYAAHIGAVIRPQHDLSPNEPGWSFQAKEKHFICTNTHDKPDRRRFTVCHEIAHIVLSLPSDHKHAPWSGNYAKKSADEITCDVFAAELLLPLHLFKPLAERARVGFYRESRR